MRRVPDDNLAYPVLVRTGNSTGSGFFLKTESCIYFVTARHVLYDQAGSFYDSEAELTAYGSNPKDTSKNVLRLNLPLIENNNHVKSDAQRDLAVSLIGVRRPDEQDMQIVQGVSIISLSTTGVLGVGVDAVRLFADVLVANDIFVFGYPVSLGLQHMPQLDFSRPLLRSGIVAGTNTSLKTIILDCAVYPGNSGGPVVEVEPEGFGFRYRVIGVVIQYVPAFAQVLTVATPSQAALVNSGYSVAASMDGVMALIQQL